MGSLARVASDERRLARQLILAGRSSLRLAAVERERRRLVKRARRCAHAIDRIRAATENPRWLLRGSRPLFHLHVVVAVAPELARLAAALRADAVHPAGVVMAFDLLTDAQSPLYGEDVQRLRAALIRTVSRLDGYN
jgi:hypothetical protein